MITALIYERGELRSSRNIHEIEVAVQHKTASVWVNFSEPDNDEYKLLGKLFGFHHLVVDDTKHFTGLPKIEEHTGYLFIIFHELAYHNGHLGINEIDLFLGEQYFVTLHREKDSGALQRVRNRIHQEPALMKDHPMLLHAVLDSIVDDYLPILDAWEDRAAKLENQVVTKDAKQDTVNQLLKMRRMAGKLRRSLAPQRDIISKLTRRELPHISEQSIPYFRDIHDHLMNVFNTLDTVKDSIQATFEAYMSVSNQRLNQIMYKLTLIMSIFVPLTFITGIYGMNFTWMPWLRSPNGFWIILGVMLLIAIGFQIYFKKHEFMQEY